MAISLQRWEGKVAVVTGASSGIGAEVTRQLVRYGLKVVGLARRKDKIEKMKKELKTIPGHLYALKTDITKEEDIVRAFNWVEHNVGPVHILVNCAGMFYFGSFLESCTEHWQKTFDTNVLGLCMATREAVKTMQRDNIDGQIINIGSDFNNPMKSYFDFNVYPASKLAVKAITKATFEELNLKNSKIKITSINPGNVNSNFIKSSGANGHYVAAMKIIPYLEPKDVADAVCYVLSTSPNVVIPELFLNAIG